MAEQFGRTQNLSFYDQVLLQADKKAEGLVMDLTGGRPNPALQNKITLGLLAEMRAPVIEDALRRGRGERAAMGDVSLTGMRTEGMVQRGTMKRAMDKKVREQVLADAKRLGMLKVGEILISESPKIYMGWKKAQVEKDAEAEEAAKEALNQVGVEPLPPVPTTRRPWEEGAFPPEWRTGGSSVGDFPTDLVRDPEGGAAVASLGFEPHDLVGSPYEREADYFTKMLIEGGAAPLQERLV